jgi:cyclin-dependent kinase 12/13
VFEYDKAGDQVGEGTYGSVYKATNKETGQVVALKKVNMTNEKDGFPITAIREIKILSRLNHPCIVQLKEIVTSKATEYNRNKGTIFMVFEYMDHDLTGLIDNPKIQFSSYEVKLYMKQMLEGLKYCHGQNVLHRDVKGANMLINNGGVLKIADFGLSRDFTKDPQQRYTNKVVTLWYRPPELLLGTKNYRAAIDLWSVGIVFAEMLAGKPFLQGQNEITQLDLIFRWCGAPDETNWPGHHQLPFYETLKSICGKYVTEKIGDKVQLVHERRLRQHPNLRDRVSDDAFELLDKLLKLDPSQRLDADAALKHHYFWTDPVVDLDRIDLSQCTAKCEASHEYQVKKKRQLQQAPAKVAREAQISKRPALGMGPPGPARVVPEAPLAAPSAVPRSQQNYAAAREQVTSRAPPRDTPVPAPSSRTLSFECPLCCVPEPARRQGNVASRGGLVPRGRGRGWPGRGDGVRGWPGKKK